MDERATEEYRGPDQGQGTACCLAAELGTFGDPSSAAGPGPLEAEQAVRLQQVAEPSPSQVLPLPEDEDLGAALVETREGEAATVVGLNRLEPGQASANLSLAAKGIVAIEVVDIGAARAE